jgi:hypothetical protein
MKNAVGETNNNRKVCEYLQHEARHSSIQPSLPDRFTAVSKSLTDLNGAPWKHELQPIMGLENARYCYQEVHLHLANE